MHRSFVEMTPVTFETHFLGDGATPTRLYSPDSGAVSAKRAEACEEDANACDVMREGPSWIA